MEQEKIINIEELVQDEHNFNKGTDEGGKLIERSFKEMGAGRSVLIDKHGKIIAGNKSQKAAIAAGIKRVRVIETTGDELIAVKRTDVELESEQGRKMALLDNLTTQVNLAWDETELQTITGEIEGFDVGDFGFDVDDLPIAPPMPTMADTTREEAKKRQQWGKDKDYTEPVCDLTDHTEIHALRGYRYLHSFKTGTEGIPISEIKTEANVQLFAQKAEELIRSIIGIHTPQCWAVTTTPKRRHKEKNFASMVCAELSRLLGIPFYDDAVEAKDRARIDPVFTLVKEIKEDNLIIYDDILTGGTTLYTTANLFPDKNKLLVVGINNHR